MQAAWILLKEAGAIRGGLRLARRGALRPKLEFAGLRWLTRRMFDPSSSPSGNRTAAKPLRSKRSLYEEAQITVDLFISSGSAGAVPFLSCGRLMEEFWMIWRFARKLLKTFIPRRTLPPGIGGQHPIVASIFEAFFGARIVPCVLHRRTSRLLRPGCTCR
jgi:hypothetical protein